jgi:hypothetical protein
MPTFNLGDYGDETSDSDDEEAPPAAPVGRVRDKGFGHSGGQFGPKRQMGDSPFRAVGQMGD